MGIAVLQNWVAIRELKLSYYNMLMQEMIVSSNLTQAPKLPTQQARKGELFSLATTAKMFVGAGLECPVHLEPAFKPMRPQYHMSSILFGDTVVPRV